MCLLWLKGNTVGIRTHLLGELWELLKGRW